MIDGHWWVDYLKVTSHLCTVPLDRHGDLRRVDAGVAQGAQAPGMAIGVGVGEADGAGLQPSQTGRAASGRPRSRRSARRCGGGIWELQTRKGYDRSVTRALRGANRADASNYTPFRHIEWRAKSRSTGLAWPRHRPSRPRWRDGDRLSRTRGGLRPACPVAATEGAAQRSRRLAIVGPTLACGLLLAVDGDTAMPRSPGRAQPAAGCSGGGPAEHEGARLDPRPVGSGPVARPTADPK